MKAFAAARLLRESKAGRWQNALAAKARGFLEIVVCLKLGVVKFLHVLHV